VLDEWFDRPIPPGRVRRRPQVDLGKEATLEKLVGLLRKWLGTPAKGSDQPSPANGFAMSRDQARSIRKAFLAKNPKERLAAQQDPEVARIVNSAFRQLTDGA